MTQFNVRYYAILRETVGKASEQVTSDAHTPTTLYRELAEHYGFTITPIYLKVSVNDKVSAWDHPLKNNDRVAFMPPFSGG